MMTATTIHGTTFATTIVLFMAKSY